MFISLANTALAKANERARVNVCARISVTDKFWGSGHMPHEAARVTPSQGVDNSVEMFQFSGFYLPKL